MFRLLTIQIKQIQQGGLPVLARKCLLAILIFISVPLVILARALRPIVLIRFRCLNSPRLGHYAANTELYLCEKDFGLHGPKTIDIFGVLPYVCNQFLHTKWKEHLRISRMGRALDIANRKLPLRDAHIIPISSDKDPHGLLKNTRSHITFTESESNAGRDAINKLGIPANSPFVCFFTRDDAYLNETYPNWGDWSRHDFRDSSVTDCLQACEKLTSLGYYVVRMGAIVKEPLQTDNAMIIDYSLNARSDFLDIFLPSQCDFFFGSCAGLNAVPRIFRKPMGYINFVPLDYEHFFTCAPNSILIPKKLWLQNEERLMTFREIIETGANGFKTSNEYQQHGIKLIDNSPQEIEDLVIEMHNRVTKTWASTSSEEKIQEEFLGLFESPYTSHTDMSRAQLEQNAKTKWSMQITLEDLRLKSTLQQQYGDTYNYGAIDLRIGTSFLKANQNLLN